MSKEYVNDYKVSGKTGEVKDDKGKEKEEDDSASTESEN
jgi:hypothetical protein